MLLMPMKPGPASGFITLLSATFLGLCPDTLDPSAKRTHKARRVTGPDARYAGNPESLDSVLDGMVDDEELMFDLIVEGRIKTIKVALVVGGGC